MLLLEFADSIAKDFPTKSSCRLNTDSMIYIAKSALKTNYTKTNCWSRPQFAHTQGYTFEVYWPQYWFVYTRFAVLPKYDFTVLSECGVRVSYTLTYAVRMWSHCILHFSLCCQNVESVYLTLFTVLSECGVSVSFLWRYLP